MKRKRDFGSSSVPDLLESLVKTAQKMGAGEVIAGLPKIFRGHSGCPVDSLIVFASQAGLAIIEGEGETVEKIKEEIMQRFLKKIGAKKRQNKKAH